MPAAKALQDAWQPGAGEVLRSADAQAVADRRAVQPGAGLALQLDDVAGIGVERLARLGQLQAAGGAAEQADAGCLFQALDMPADRGGSEREIVRGEGEAATVDHFEKGTQQHDIQGLGGGDGKLHEVFHSSRFMNSRR